MVGPNPMTQSPYKKKEDRSMETQGRSYVNREAEMVVVLVKKC